MLDMDQINALDNDAKARYMALEKVFAMPGFKFLTAWAKAKVEEAANGVLNAQTWDQHCFANGARWAYANFAGCEEMFQKEFELLADEANNAQIDEDEGNDE